MRRLDDPAQFEAELDALAATAGQDHA